MARGKDVPESIRDQIVGMRLVGTKFSQISAILDVNLNTAQKIYYHWEETGDCTDVPRSGAPQKLTERTLTQIKRHIRHDREQRRQPLEEIIIDLNL